MARNTGGKSNFSNEIKSSMSAKPSTKPKEGSAKEEAGESKSFEANEQAQLRKGASPAAAHVAAQGNPQNTNHLQGGAQQPPPSGPGAMPQAPPMQPHMSGVGATGVDANPIVHASSIAHAILRHGQPSGVV